MVTKCPEFEGICNLAKKIANNTEILSPTKQKYSHLQYRNTLTYKTVILSLKIQLYSYLQNTELLLPTIHYYSHLQNINTLTYNTVILSLKIQ